jgi:hypothetical protein
MPTSQLQHTGSRDGQPDDFMWCEVSNLSNAALASPTDALDSDGVTVLGGVLVDVVDGDIDFLYRRHSADWLRVIPLDVEDDEVNTDACARYEIRIEPIG